MEQEKAVLIFNDFRTGKQADIEVPLSISANELIVGLNEAFLLGIDPEDVKNCYLKAENPFVLLKGDRTLAEFGIRNGTEINFT